MKREQIVELFTKYGKEPFGIWFSGVKGEGEYLGWSDDGKLYSHGFYKNNELNGEYRVWHKNGQLMVQTFLKAGKVEGEYKTWNESGRLMSHHLYKDDKMIKDYFQ